MAAAAINTVLYVGRRSGTVIEREYCLSCALKGEV